MDYMKPFGCNCQNKVSPDACPRQNEAVYESHHHHDDCHDNHHVRNDRHFEDCNKFEQTDVLSDMPLAMAYVPWQTWKNVYDASNGLRKGTIFGELILPFLFASPVCRENTCNNGRRCDTR